MRYFLTGKTLLLIGFVILAFIGHRYNRSHPSCPLENLLFIAAYLGFMAGSLISLPILDKGNLAKKFEKNGQIKSIILYVFSFLLAAMFTASLYELASSKDKNCLSEPSPYYTRPRLPGTML